MKNWETIADDDLFVAILKNIKENTELHITKENKYEGDNFLNLRTYPSMKVTFMNKGLTIVLFNDSEPMLLEDCPKSFWRTIVKNL